MTALYAGFVTVLGLDIDLVGHHGYGYDWCLTGSVDLLLAGALLF